VLNRITLRAYPTATKNTVSNYTTYGLGYTQTQAEMIFRSQDDLLLNAPEGDNPPTQLFSTVTSNGTTTNNRRQFQGDYSWLATVVPSYRSYQVVTSGSPATYTLTPQGDTNAVIVSIVVFYKRIPIIYLPADTTPPSERMLQVNMAPYQPGTTTTGLPPTGTAGGDVQLMLSATPSNNLSTSAAQQAYFNVKAGQWILLSQMPTSQASTYASGGAQAGNSVSNVSANTPFWYRWYKVVGTGPVQQVYQSSPPTYYRNVTLSGPDWNPGTAGTPTATYASIFDGVVAVYEKEMELEQSGAPWAPN
jgi:hypothetical protein